MATDFGKDVSCTTELHTGRYASGSRVVAEAAYRRLTTPRGMLRGGEDEANYGLDLTELIGSASTKADAAALPSRVKAELLKDERIISANVVVTPTREGATTTYLIAITAETTAGPFTLGVGVADVTVQLLGIEDK